MNFNLEIDDSNMSEPFLQAAKNPDNLGATLANLEEGIRTGNRPNVRTGSVPAAFASSRPNAQHSASTSASSSSAATATAGSAAAASNYMMFGSAGYDDYFVPGMTEDEHMRKARSASIAAQSDDHGGKMPHTIDLLDDDDDDGETPPPPSRIQQTQHPSTMSTMGSHSYPSTLSQGQGGSALLSTFNAAGSQVMQGQGTKKSGAERTAYRKEVANDMFDKILKGNSYNMHNNIEKDSRTTPQKRQRVEAKKRKKKLVEDEGKGDAHKVGLMRDLIGRGEQTLSQGGPELSTPTLLKRFDRARASDSEEE